MTRGSEDYDVVVVGAGAGGGACAYALVKAGVKVCLVDAGPEYKAADYRLHRDDWELEIFPDKQPPRGRQTFAPLQALQEKHRELGSWNHIQGEFNPGPQRLADAYHHVQGIGGSTLHYTGEAHRLNPLSMAMHSRFGVAADWPLSYDELEPFYQQAETIIGVAGKTSPRCPRSSAYPLPQHPLNYNSQILERGFRDCGMTLEPNSLAILSRPYQQRPACNHCNNCLRGCPRADKGSVDVTFIRQIRAADNFTLRSLSPVTQLEYSKRGEIKGVLCSNQQGQMERLSARVVVLACGAVETPRLLLNTSAIENQARINEHGQLGKHFMETLFWQASALHPEPLGSHRGIPSDSICWDFNQPDAIDGIIGGCRFSSGVAEADLVGPINYATRVVPGWGKSHKQAMREQFGRVLSVGAIGENLPNPNSYIDLDPEHTDAQGLPKARIHSFLDDMECERLHFMRKQCLAVLEASAAEPIFERYGSYDFFSSTHVFGGCRMGTKAENSVVDAYGQCHNQENLFITDASVFPSTGGGEAPSLTIQALALRSGQYIAESLRQKNL